MHVYYILNYLAHSSSEMLSDSICTVSWHFITLLCKSNDKYFSITTIIWCRHQIPHELILMEWLSEYRLQSLAWFQLSVFAWDSLLSASVKTRNGDLWGETRQRDVSSCPPPGHQQQIVRLGSWRVTRLHFINLCALSYFQKQVSLSSYFCTPHESCFERRTISI